MGALQAAGLLIIGHELVDDMVQEKDTHCLPLFLPSLYVNQIIAEPAPSAFLPPSLNWKSQDYWNPKTFTKKK